MSQIAKMQKWAVARWRGTGKRLRVSILSILLLLILVRLSLPYAVKYYVNHQLRQIPEFSGSIGRIVVHLWRGSYEIRDVKIVKTGGKVPVPFFSTPSLGLSLQWRELFHGAIVGEVVLDRPKLNFVGATNSEQSQTGVNKPWGATISSFFPFTINRFEIHGGEVHFQNFERKPPVNIYVYNLQATATNLTNSRNLHEKLPSGIHAAAQALGDGQVTVDLKLNPLQPAPTFELNASVTNVDLVQLNDFLRSYGKLDVAKGNLSLFTSTASLDGNYKGYIKVMFKDLAVFEWEKERKKNVLDIFWESIVGVLGEGFRNHRHDQLAAQIPISGSFTNLHADLWSTTGSLLKNAFVRGLVPKIDPAYKIQDVEKEK